MQWLLLMHVSDATGQCRINCRSRNMTSFSAFQLTTAWSLSFCYKLSSPSWSWMDTQADLRLISRGFDLDSENWRDNQLISFKEEKLKHFCFALLVCYNQNLHFLFLEKWLQESNPKLTKPNRSTVFTCCGSFSISSSVSRQINAYMLYGGDRQIQCNIVVPCLLFVYKYS